MPVAQINFTSQKVSFPFPRKIHLKKWILQTLFQEGFIASRIDFIFCTDQFLLGLNEQFLSHKEFTDILTFDYTSENTPEEISGEIFISVERVKENAEKYSVSFQVELNRVIIHGVLHLCGYKDKTSADKKIMTKKENEYLALQQNLKK